MSQNSSLSNWAFYSIGFIFLLLAIAFFLIPIVSRSGTISGLKIPWIILYVYNKGGFYFATSPILLIISVISIGVFLLRK